MASEQEETQERIERILVRVRAGQPIKEAVLAEKIYAWYYKQLTFMQRKPIVAARQEYQQLERMMPGSGKAYFITETIPERRSAFQKVCNQLGVSMSARINTLITNDINAHRGMF